MKKSIALLVGIVPILMAVHESSAADYYVNDGSTSGDVYCSGAGSDATGGGSAGAPYASITNLLAQEDLDPGDTVYIDTLFANVSETPS